MSIGPTRTLEEQIERFKGCCNKKNLLFIGCIPTCILYENRSQPFLTVQCKNCGHTFSTNFQQLIHRQPTCIICKGSDGENVKNAIIPRDVFSNPVIIAPDFKSYPETGFRPLENIRQNPALIFKMTACCKHWKVEPQCFSCGLKTWKGATILEMGELDHIDGNPKNNEPQNIRLLCPNCHRQTLTYKRGQAQKALLQPTSKATTFKDIQTQNIMQNISEISSLPHYIRRQRLQCTIPKGAGGKAPPLLADIFDGTKVPLSSSVLGDRLIFDKLKPAECHYCGCTVWRAIPNALLMDLHHEDYVNSNNAITNINLYCRNCHRLLHLMKRIN
jgi:5-methylcytosine-specific restriction endonuclease McrA